MLVKSRTVRKIIEYGTKVFIYLIKYRDSESEEAMKFKDSTYKGI